jgi:hypothetical protein
MEDYQTKVTKEADELKVDNKNTVKKKYFNAEIGLSEAIQILMFDYFMERNEALKYLGL